MGNRRSEVLREHILPLFFCCQLATLGLLRQAPAYSLAAETIAGYPLIFLWIARTLTVAVLVAAVAAALRGRRFLPHRVGVIASGAVLVTGFALMFYAGHSPVLYLASQCLIGIAHPWLLLCWAEYLTGLEKARRTKSIAGAALLAVVIFTVMAALPPTAAAPCYLILACGSAVPLLAAAPAPLEAHPANEPPGASAPRAVHKPKRRPDRRAFREPADGPLRSKLATLAVIPWELIVLMASYALLFRILVFFDLPVPHEGLEQLAAAIIRIGGMGLLLLYLRRTHFTPNTQQIIAPLFFLTLLGLALLPGPQELAATLAVALISSSWTFFYVLMWLILPEIADERDADPFIALIGGWTMLNALLLLAAPLAYFFEVQVTQGTLSLTALVLIVIYTLTAALPLYRHSAKRAAAAEGGIKAESVAPEAASPHERFETAARAQGLTPRETEVFLLLIEGYSLPAIEERFVLSHSTVKTHARHIYEKFGVKTKQELIATLKEPR